MSAFIAESKALVKLGAPMAATQFFILAMGFLDTAMAGHYSATDLAGVALGSNVLWPVFMLMTGVNMALVPITAQLRGANKVGDVGSMVRQGTWYAIASIAIGIAILTNVHPLFDISGIDPSAAAIGAGYLDAAAWGMPPAMLYITLRYTCEGLGKTLPPMIIVGVALVLNGILNYAFIYGELGAPELGGVGCGWATAIVMWFELVLMATLLRAPYFRETKVLSHFEWPQGAKIKEILKIGVPIALTSFINMAVFSVITFLVGGLGVIPLAAHSIAGNINWATYVVPMSIGGAASIRVGYFVGARRFDAARQSGAAAFKLSMGYAVIVSSVLVLAREEIVGIYSTDPEVLAVASTLLLFIALYQLADDAQGTISATLRGYKDTTVPMVFGIIGYWLIALPLGSWLSDSGYGVYGYWTGLAIGLTAVAVCLGARLLRTSKNEQRILRLAAA